MSCILPLRTWPGSRWASISMLWMYIRRSRYVRLLGVGWPWWSAQTLRGEPAKAKPAPAARCKNLRLVEAGDLRADETTSEAPVFLGKQDLFIGVSDPSFNTSRKIGPLYHRAANRLKNYSPSNSSPGACWLRTLRFVW